LYSLGGAKIMNTRIFYLASSIDRFTRGSWHRAMFKNINIDISSPLCCSHRVVGQEGSDRIASGNNIVIPFFLYRECHSTLVPNFDSAFCRHATQIRVFILTRDTRSLTIRGQFRSIVSPPPFVHRPFLLYLGAIVNFTDL